MRVEVKGGLIVLHLGCIEVARNGRSRPLNGLKLEVSMAASDLARIAEQVVVDAPNSDIIITDGDVEVTFSVHTLQPQGQFDLALAQVRGQSDTDDLSDVGGGIEGDEQDSSDA